MAIKFPIVRPVLPAIDVYQKYVQSVFDSKWLTNSGPLHQQLEQRLAEHLGVEHLMLVANGTFALQVAYQALGLTDSSRPILTTPFSFAATASSVAWQGHQCQFVDIDSSSLNIDPKLITQEQVRAASAIVATHVFGNPCDVHHLEKLTKGLDTKVIYDAAHAFNCRLNGESVLNWGDASTLSLHATKIFHCVEGGAIVFKKAHDLQRAKEMINFGFNRHQYPENVGINAKMSEMHAAMGLSLLDDVDAIQEQRIEAVDTYKSLLNDDFEFQQWVDGSCNNGAYMPILCKDEKQLLKLMQHLTEDGVQTRRYFYPSLSEVECYGKRGETPIANEISRRVLCLPLYGDLTVSEVKQICGMVKSALR
ncbi:DegT/DnrJ/EryC1/StrS family aminotransferase [Shewanella waksmanii]|uniref:DegT/DnrJ/EryC1/StrS family aminotransferase n=1 Tax=Shewanella waksmanii TaxID=213783 RepID=UPI0037356356